jgi:hypothetical protein
MAILFPLLSGAAPIVFSSFPSTSVPETISAVPAGFGNQGGNYFVLDATTNTVTDATGIIQSVPSGGGAPTDFATTPLNPRNGLFLPNDFGGIGGDFAVANFAGNAPAGIDPVANFGAVTLFNSSGTASTLYSANNFQPVSLAIAPSGFGSFGGDLIVGFTSTQAGVAALDSSGDRTDLVDGLPFAPIGAAFAPAGFGNFGGDLFIASDRSPIIDIVNGSGNVSLFTNLPLPSGQGLKLLSFVPAGFGQYAGDVMVGVPGSSLGASNGMLLIVDPSGNVVAQLDGFNPRGFTFIDGGTEMLVAHTDPGVLEVAPSDFTAVPEPASIVLSGLGLAAALAFRRVARA